MGAQSDLLWLLDTLQRNPGCPHHGVPDEAFVPHLNNEAQVQPVDLTEKKKKQNKKGGIQVSSNVKLP